MIIFSIPWIGSKIEEMMIRMEGSLWIRHLKTIHLRIANYIG